MWDWMQHQMAWGNMGGMGFGMLLFWALIIALIVLVVRNVSTRDDDAGRTASRSPLDILKERYARGEIEQDEFERKRRDLQA